MAGKAVVLEICWCGAAMFLYLTAHLHLPTSYERDLLVDTKCNIEEYGEGWETPQRWHRPDMTVSPHKCIDNNISTPVAKEEM